MAIAAVPVRFRLRVLLISFYFNITFFVAIISFLIYGSLTLHKLVPWLTLPFLVTSMRTSGQWLFVNSIFIYERILQAISKHDATTFRHSSRLAKPHHLFCRLCHLPLIRLETEKPSVKKRRMVSSLVSSSCDAIH